MLQPVLTADVLQPSDQICAPLHQTPANRSMSSCAEAPELNAVLRVGSHQSRLEQQDLLPRPADYAASEAAQDTVGSVHVAGSYSVFIHQHPRVLLRRTALSSRAAQPVFVRKTKGQDVPLFLGLFLLSGSPRSYTFDMNQAMINPPWKLECIRHVCYKPFPTAESL